MRSLTPLLVLGAVLFATLDASAYCRTTTCAQTNPPSECSPIPAACDCQTAGNPLYWGQSCVSFSVQQDGSPALGITADELELAIRECFDNWQNAQCSDGGTPNMTVETFPQVECSTVGYSSDKKNQNLWTFRDGTWPQDDPTGSTIALTSVSFDKESGEIYDVDVELNSANYEFVLETTAEGTDLLSVVQHESGHFLGLAHSDGSDTTMYCSYGGDAKMRTLAADDIAGICAIYPPTDSPDTSCDPTPRHGFSTKCSESADSGCSVAGPFRTSRSLALAVLGLGLLAFRRRYGKPQLP